MKTKSAEKSPHGRIAFCLPHKLFHRCLSRLADPCPCEDLPNRYDDDLDIQPHRPIVHIPNIQPEFLFPSDGIAGVDLHPTSNTRLLWFNQAKKFPSFFFYVSLGFFVRLSCDLISRQSVFLSSIDQFQRNSRSRWRNKGDILRAHDHLIGILNILF